MIALRWRVIQLNSTISNFYILKCFSLAVLSLTVLMHIFIHMYISFHETNSTSMLVSLFECWNVCFLYLFWIDFSKQKKKLLAFWLFVFLFCCNLFLLLRTSHSLSFLSFPVFFFFFFFSAITQFELWTFLWLLNKKSEPVFGVFLVYFLVVLLKSIRI